MFYFRTLYKYCLFALKRFFVQTGFIFYSVCTCLPLYTTPIVKQTKKTYKGWKKEKCLNTAKNSILTNFRCIAAPERLVKIHNNHRPPAAICLHWDHQQLKKIGKSFLNRQIQNICSKIKI